MDIYLSRLMPPTRSRALAVALGAVCAATLAGCWDPDPCDPGQIFVLNACMYPVPPTGTTGSGGAAGSDAEGGGDAAGGGGAAGSDAEGGGGAVGGGGAAGGGGS